MAALHASAQDLIADGNVDAVLVASWGPAHEEQVVAAIADSAGQPGRQPDGGQVELLLQRLEESRERS